MTDPSQPTPSEAPAAGWAGTIHRLLLDPLAVIRPDADPQLGRRLVVVALISTMAYGATAGLFRGGWQVLESALKAPLVVALALALAAPSLLVFTTLSGVRWTPRSFNATLAGFTTLAALVLTGLLPIAWLFSTASRYLGAVVVVHVFCWLIALAFAGRFLAQVLTALGGRGGAALWVLLLFVVSLQVATVSRPVLWRSHDAPLIDPQKRFFLEHFAKSASKSAPSGEARRARPATP